MQFCSKYMYQKYRSHVATTAYDYAPNNSNQIKFADDVTGLVLISSNDES